jgi:hypothetical protein
MKTWTQGGAMPHATYDQIADWYEEQFLARQTGDPLGIQAATLTGEPRILWAPIGRGSIELERQLEILQEQAPDPAVGISFRGRSLSSLIRFFSPSKERSSVSKHSVHIFWLLTPR